MKKMFLLTLLILVCSMIFAQSNEITDDTIIYIEGRELTVGQLRNEILAFQNEARETLGAYTKEDGTLYIPMPESERLALQKQKELSEQQILNDLRRTRLDSRTLDRYSASYSNTWGDANKFAVNLNAGADISATSQQRAFHAHITAGATIVNNSATMASFELGAEQTGNKPEGASAKAWGKLSILGYTVWGPSYSTSAPIQLAGLDAPIAHSWEATARFMVGPVPMSAKFTLGVMAGLELQLSVIPSELAITGSITPYITTDLVIDVAVDIVVASAGVRGEITFFDNRLPIVAKASYSPSSQAVHATLTVNNELHLLDGSISLFAQAFGQDIAELEIFAWEGFAKTWCIYSQSY